MSNVVLIIEISESGSSLDRMVIRPFCAEIMVWFMVQIPALSIRKTRREFSMRGKKRTAGENKSSVNLKKQGRGTSAALHRTGGEAAGRGVSAPLHRAGRGVSASLHRTGGRAGLAVCLLVALLCTGCGAGDGAMSDMGSSNNMYSNGNMSPSVAGGSYEGIFDLDSAGVDSVGTSGGGSVKNNVDVTVDTDRKMIRTVNLTAETREFEQAMTTLEDQVRQLGGYIESLETYNGSKYSGSGSTRYSNMTARIPKANLYEFLESVSGVCNVVRKNEDIKDVTLSYVDIESRRDTLRTEQERLLSFLEKAETVQEIIDLEERLSEVRYQLESMEARLRTMDNQVDYATVNLNLSEVRELTPVEEPTVWEQLAEGFMDSVGNIGDGILNFCIWFAVNSPYLAFWALIIALLVFFIRRSYRRSRKKLLAKAAKADAEWKAAAPVQPGSGNSAEAPAQSGSGLNAPENIVERKSGSGLNVPEDNGERESGTGSNTIEDENKTQ